MILRISHMLQIIWVRKLPFIICCALMLYSNFVLGQEEKTKLEELVSKETQLFISQSDSIEKIEELIQDIFYAKKDTLLGLQYSKYFLERGKTQENYEIQYFSSFQIAYVEYNRSDYKQALKYAYQSVKVAEKLQDTINSISSNILLGSTWYVLGNYEDALESYLTAKELASHIENSSYEIICLTNVANTRIKLNRYEDALKSYDLIIKTLDEKKDASFVQFKETYLSSLLGKGLCLIELGIYQKAQETFDKGIKLAEANDLQIYKGYFYISLGKLSYEKKEYHASLGFLKQGKDKLQNYSGLQNNLRIADYYVAKCYYQQKKYEEAILLLDENFERIGDNLLADKLEEMYQLAIDISKIQTDQNKQVIYYSKLREITKFKRDRKSAAKDLLHNDDLKDYDIRNEKLENEKTQSLIDKRIISTISIVILILLLTIFLLYRRKTKIKEQKFLAIIEKISHHQLKDTSQKVSQDYKIKDEKAKVILEKLQELENTHFYLSQDCNLYTTAKLLNTNTTYLSKALNDVKKQSFNQYLNKLRIDYVLVKLKEDSVFRSYTIHAVSKEIGYKSATTFIKEFKNKTGLNPSYYIKKIEN
ncbi:helix-turn-helix domain-containing protein [Kordia antarctica]|nr:helix-turn-helix domain-containing protein [Kordia antarctica]